MAVMSRYLPFNIAEPERLLSEFPRPSVESKVVVAGQDLKAECKAILADEYIACVHIRPRFNCFQCRVGRARISA